MHGHGIGITSMILDKTNIIFTDSLFLPLGLIINVAMKLTSYNQVIKVITYYIDLQMVHVYIYQLRELQYIAY